MNPTRILVIDDDADIRAFLRTALESRGYAVSEAASGAEGLAMARAETPDLIVLDVMMETVDAGFQLAPRFAEIAKDTPILLLSSIGNAAAAVFDTWSLPVSEIVNKPILPADLLARVERLLARR